MSLYKFIIDPINKQKYSYNSLEYKEILKKYIHAYKLGGNNNKNELKQFLLEINETDKKRQKNALNKRKKRKFKNKKFKLQK